MKKMTLQQKCWHARKVRLRFSIRKFEADEFWRFNRYKARFEIKAPEKLLLTDDDGEKTLRFFSALRNVGGSGRKMRYINLSKLKEISPVCCLLLCSEVDRWLNVKSTEIKIEDKIHPEVALMLNQTGVFQHLKAANAPEMALEASQDTKKIFFLPIKSGKQQEPGVGQAMQEEINHICTNFQVDLLLNDGVKEAVENVINWAYDGVLKESPNSKWWLSASYSPVTRTACFMVCDHGRTIPKTLPRSRFFLTRGVMQAAIDSIMGQSDAKIIETALKVGKSATAQSHRGKGLPQMQEYILENKKGFLRILSHHGDYNMDEQGAVVLKDWDNPFLGTLIAWEVPVNEDVQGE